MNEDKLNAIGEEFGKQLAVLFSNCLIRAVTVVETTETHAHVSVFEGDTPIRVPLSLLNIGSSMLRVVPTVGSTALICSIDGNQNTPYFIAFESVEKVTASVGGSVLDVETKDGEDTINLTVGSSSIKVTSEEIAMNGGGLGGLVKLKELENNLNSLKVYCERLKSAVSSGLNAVGTGPSASGQAGASSFELAMMTATIRFDNMENEKIKQ